jgi:hypothetical protein
MWSLATGLLWTTTAHADPCKSLGVGKDAGSSIAVTAMVRHLAGLPPTALTLELRGEGSRLVVNAPPASAGTPATDPGVFAFEEGPRASWPQHDEGRLLHMGKYVFTLDREQLELLESRPLLYVALPLSGGELFELNLDKDNQKTVQAGARCILSRTAP